MSEYSQEPGCYDWPDQYAGDTVEETAFVFKSDGSPMPLTGATIRMMVRKNGNTAPVISKTSVGEDGIRFTDAANGTFVIGGFVNPDVSGVFMHDIEVTFSDGRVRTFLAGQYQIFPQVTK